MINYLSSKFNKAIAAILFFIFYSSIVIAGIPVRQKLNSYQTLIINKDENISLRNNAKVDKSRIELPRVENNNTENKKIRIGGPTQPEMSSFKPVETNNLVNNFTGDFSYNLPLLDVGGYPINIFYNAGITPEQEASWVGLGWNINPGTITRNMRGVPDEFNGEDQLIEEKNMKPNITWGVNLSPDFKVGGVEIAEILSEYVDVNLGLSVNNYLGPAIQFGAGTSIKKLQKLAGTEKNVLGPADANLGFRLNSRDGASLDFGASLNFQSSLYSYWLKSNIGIGVNTSYNSRVGIRSL